jgi:UDP-glucose 4-epimerase
MKSRDSVLLTGSSGFLGRFLKPKLMERNFEVQTFDQESGDIRNWDDLKDISADVIYHLAAITYVPFSFENPRATYETNVLGTLNILELCRKSDIKKMIYTSGYIYGKPKYLPINEEHPINPTNPYMQSKLIGEELCQKYSELYGTHCIVIRPFNIYGEGQDERFLIPTILKQAEEKGEIVLENPEPKRDFLYVEDLVEAYIKAGEQNFDFEIFNIGRGESYSVREIVDRVVNIYDEKIKVRYTGKKRKNEILNVVADIEKAKKELGWSPQTDLFEWLKKIIKK